MLMCNANKTNYEKMLQEMRPAGDSTEGYLFKMKKFQHVKPKVGSHHANPNPSYRPPKRP